MRKLYLAHWATPEDLDAERDDSMFDNVADMAEPSGTVLRSKSKASIAKLLEIARKDVWLMVGPDETDDEVKVYLRAKWRLAKGPIGREFYNRWELVDPKSGDEQEPLIQLIVREAAIL